MQKYQSVSGSSAEDLFIDLFTDVFGIERAGFLISQYPFEDIYNNSRFADFMLISGNRKIAIEIDDEATHNKAFISEGKFYDDLLKQNSMVHKGWDVYRWAVRQMQKTPDSVKDELKVFLGDYHNFQEIQDYLPEQKGKSIDGNNLELRGYQLEALESLKQMRTNKETIALLYQATGTGKTVTAVMDAKAVGGRVLFVAHTMELVNQSKATFESLWKEVSVGKFAENNKDIEAHVVCGSIQSIALNLDMFADTDFDYLIIDEAHHATAETYQKVLSYFKPKFILGLTATPERADEVNILDVFKNTAHKLDIQTAVEIGALVPVRCIRIHTNIDMTKVRFNNVQYNIRDLDVKICVTERNRLIVDTWLEYVKNKRTVVFCASVKHAEQIAAMFKANNVPAFAVSGSMKTAERNEALAKFAKGEIKVLCACDLLNEGWDCPETEVLFMARPTMSKVLYMQQLGRGMRLSEGKEYLMVFDFVDNASQFNAPYSLHRIFHLNEYHAGGTVLGRKGQREEENDLYAKGEKPDAIIDYPVHVSDYELVDIFNWQEEAAGMISQIQFVRQVDVQSETVERYLREGIIVPDLIVPISENRTLKYFKEETLLNYADKFGWNIITETNRKQLFMKMVEQMDMSYSYKPVLLKAVLSLCDEKGRVKINEVVEFFISFYENRRRNGLIVEKSNSIFAKGGYTNAEVERNILSNPFKRFENMDMMHHTKTIGIIAVDNTVWRKLTQEEKLCIETICNEKLSDYYKKLQKRRSI